MPLGEGLYGTKADGSEEKLYCQFCYQNGAFTKPEQTLDEMIESSVHYMTTNLHFSEEEARRLSLAVIPPLRRWKK